MRKLNTLHFMVHEQHAENPGVEDKTPVVDVKTITYTDILHIYEDQIQEIERLAKPYKNNEKDRFIDTKITDYNSDIEATMSFDELMAMLINWTE